MKRVMVSALVLGLLVAAPAWAGGECCVKAKAENAWCDHCKTGFMFNVTIAKEALYKALAGVAASGECAGCKKAAETNGTCDHCHVGIAAGKAYKAMCAYYIAKGMKMEADKIKCAGCASMCKSGLAGWCDKCSAGLVASHGFKDKAEYDKASAGWATIQAASKAPCEGCAVAMVSDGTCEHCKMSFKDGKPSKG